MKTHQFYFLTLLLGCCLLLIGVSCQKEAAGTGAQLDEIINSLQDDQEATLRKHLNSEQLDAVLLKDQPEAYQAFLGRVLFYDTNLSEDRSVSCASCHQQQYGFADNVAFSKGVNGNVTDRNSIGLASIAVTSFTFDPFIVGATLPDSVILAAINTDSVRASVDIPAEKWTTSGTSSFTPVSNSIFWDERVHTLEEQMLETFVNPKEMGMDLSEIPNRIEESEYAKILYNRAFEGGPITTENIIASISTFINQIGSADSPFDMALEADPITSIPTSPIPNPSETPSLLSPYFANFNAQENNGKRLFEENCASCHAFTLGEGFRFQFNNLQTATSNGLDIEYADKGLGSHTNRIEDNGVFKIPGLRNVALTAPYMHDGRFATLEEVVEFYSTGIQPHPNLDPLLKFSNGVPIQMDLNDRDKADLVTFLNTMTSTSLASDGNLSDPFK